MEACSEYTQAGSAVGSEVISAAHQMADEEILKAAWDDELAVWAEHVIECDEGCFTLADRSSCETGRALFARQHAARDAWAKARRRRAS